jgi:membrane protein
MQPDESGHGSLPEIKPPEPSDPLSRIKILRPVIRFLDGLFEHNGFEAASSIAFWFFLSLIPLLVFVGFVMGRLVRIKGVDMFVDPVIQLVPGMAEDLIRKELERMGQASEVPLAPLSVAGFLWTASSGLHNLMDIFEIAVKVPRRSWWKQRLIALGWVMGGLVALVIAAWVLLTIDSRFKPSDAPTSQVAQVNPTPEADEPPAAEAPPEEEKKVEKPSLKQRIVHAVKKRAKRGLFIGGLMGVFLCLLAGFYRYAVEHPVGVKRRAWPGAFAALALFLLVSWGFGAYVVSLADYALYYGSLAAVAILLVWLYLVSLSLVVGAEVNAQLEGVRD